MAAAGRIFLALTVSGLALGFFPVTAQTASACPSCKAANETDSRRPRAYMYSILFMLAMPATVFTGFGISFYRMSRREEQAAGLTLQETDAAVVSGTEEPADRGPAVPD